MSTTSRPLQLPEAGLSVSWLDYYRNNRECLLAVPWERGAEITGSEREAIWDSVREFQLGESSEGRHIIRCAHEFAARQRTPAYAEAIKLFIREEQRHARDLGRFMDLAGIPRRTRAWPDTVFRCLRHLSGLEVSISVLITAEIIAKVYYAALREATGSTVLRCLCDQILRDERQHVRFQCDYLAILRGGRRPLLFDLTEAPHRFLFFGACLVVWKSHGRAIRRGGMRFSRFWKSCWREMNEAMRHVGSAPSCLPAQNRKIRCPGDSPRRAEPRFSRRKVMRLAAGGGSS